MKRFAIVILAAGESSRMGAPKQLLDYRGKAMIRHAADVALASDCAPVIVVIGSQPDDMRAALAGAPVTIVENPQWSRGMGTSIQAGVHAAEQADVDGLVLTLSDQPLIDASILNDLLKAHRESGRPIVASEYAGTVGVPVLFTREFFPELLALKDTQGCKGVILASANEAFSIPCPQAQYDVDSPADYLRVLGM